MAGTDGGGDSGDGSNPPSTSPKSGASGAGAVSAQAAPATAAAAATGAAGAESNTQAAAANNASQQVSVNNKPPQPSEGSLVLAYLRKHGLTDAASELQTILQKDKAEQHAATVKQEKSATPDGKKRKRDDTTSGSEGEGEGEKVKKKLPQIDYDVSEEGMDIEDQKNTSDNNGEASKSEKQQKDTLKAATGGGFGYDLDAAPTIALWGAGSAPPALRNKHVTELLLEGRERDAAAESKDGDAAAKDGDKEVDKEEMEAMVNFRDEARRYIEGFTSLVTWILTLPDDPANPIGTPMTAGRPPFSGTKKQGGASGGENEKEDGNNTMDVDGDGTSSGHVPHDGLVTLVKHSMAAAERYDPAKPKPPAPHTLTLPLGATASIPSASSFRHDPLLLPPSCKPELLALSFPLLVHTYCELLTCGLEHTALALLDTYRHLYEASHGTEIADLDKCTSTKRIVELNEDVIQQSVLHSEQRLLNSQIILICKKLGEVEKEHADLEKKKTKRNNDEEKLYQEHTRRLTKYKETLAKSRGKLQALTAKNDALTTKLLALPFLRRARALKWNITISTSSFGALTGFVSSRDELLPMSALLQSRCHLIVERRDPLPFCPPALLEDVTAPEDGGDNVGSSPSKTKQVRWAAPFHPVARAIEAGEDVGRSGVSGSEPHHELARSILTHSEALPFPKLRLDDGDDSKDAETRAAVEFNRALLVNGFRRLEALELKQEYESGLLPKDSDKRQIHVADALQPSVLLATLCSSSTASKMENEADAGAGLAAVGAPWIEPNIGITSASICPPDGRRVAVGCDDAAVRIWSLDRSSPKSKNGKSSSDTAGNNNDASSMGEPSMVLLGHKNGFPVFDVDWTRDGRTLLSAGGDGTVRLWDTRAVGPYGKLSNVSVQSRNNSNLTVGGPASTSLTSPVIPGTKAESLVQVGGAALSVYRGHAPSTPVWSVSSAPSGYYFASAGSDYTARIWTTDRTGPVRVLGGHVSPSVNCVDWHPNCNYVVTASDDKTCRMFDVQTGRCVRLLSGSTRGLNLVKVSPSGRYAAGAGYDGIVRIWDLGNGRLVNELRSNTSETQALSYSEGMIHSMSFSSCGAALAVAGEDSTVRIWDVRGAGNHLSDPDYFAAARGATATSSFAGSMTTKSQLDRMPANERLRPGTRVPTKVFKTNDISIRDIKFTKRNLLLAVGTC